MVFTLTLKGENCNVKNATNARIFTRAFVAIIKIIFLYLVLPYALLY